MLTQEELDGLLKRIVSYKNAAALPAEELLLSLCDKAVSALDAEDVSYRPRAKDATPGGLLDFSAEKKPVIIVPDLHARPDFLPRLVRCKIGASSASGEEPMTVLSALNKGLLFVVCVGDCFHSETMGECYERWKRAYDEWLLGNVQNRFIQKEMQECFATLFAVLELKAAFPRNFHFLKGNHENILNVNGAGDFAFRKFVLEGQMVKDFMDAWYSEASVHVIHCFEYALPIVALFETFGISHAEPAFACTREEIVNYHEYPQVIRAFTWTANDEAEEGSVRRLFSTLRKDALSAVKAGALWFGGHRPVPDTYLLRQNGSYVQIHNPDKMNITLVRNALRFIPEKDILSIE